LKIAVVGGGPAGLYCATLIKKRRPDWPIVVLEQNAADATFGFGVVLADTGLNRLQAADTETHDRLVARMIFSERQAIVHGETPIFVKKPRTGGAITRLDLLEILQEAALSSGVAVRYGARLAHPAELERHGLADADVVIGADGINSIVRGAFESELGTTRSFLTNHFAWYGTDKVFDGPALVFRKFRGGAFVAHYYPYSSTRSTFVAECDDATWKHLGMEHMSDGERRALFEQIYAAELDSRSLISNNSSWRQFPVVRNKTWSCGKYVLLGDAHASAHFSIGSGTRIAMEDAIDLAECLIAEEASVVERLERFAAVRGPEKAKLIAASEKSYTWYEHMGQWMDRYSPHEFVYAFMTRTGRLDDRRLAAQYPELVAEIRGGLAAPESHP
jgi:2-polyprenyl-6-methoxyphenol hydroxylase-like FAD-dependent oxidoreductase